MDSHEIIIVGLIALVVIPIVVVGIIFLARPVFQAIGWILKHVWKFVASEFGDGLRLIGGAVTSVVFAVLGVGSILFGKRVAAEHYWGRIPVEWSVMLGCVYRLVIGNPARLLLLTPLVEGLEQRIPMAMATSPGARGSSWRQGQFEGYTIVGTLPGGGSGSRLFIATPTAEKRAGLLRTGLVGAGVVDRVVIKSFSLADGSTLPQIIRENRALPAAKRMGLILEHDLTEERFYYVTPYVPGESLSVVVTRLHAASTETGLSVETLREGVGYVADLLSTLRSYHGGGLWHKDVKPDNIIVSDGRAHLVDFGLITPLRSAMTLTTHGTEYFRDPEMVRMALRGVRVHEVDGVRFDVYAAGSVLYSIIENSFPAHGGLSQISKRCPEALKWIVRRAMADYDKRYDTAGAMLGDIRAVLDAVDPFGVRPADLPSVYSSKEASAMSQTAAPSAGLPDQNELGGTSVGRRATSATTASPQEAPKVQANTGARVGVPIVQEPVHLELTSWLRGTYTWVVPTFQDVEGATGITGLNAALERGERRAKDSANRADRRARLRRQFGGGAVRNSSWGIVLAAAILLAGIVVIVSALQGRSEPRANVSETASAEVAGEQILAIDTNAADAVGPRPGQCEVVVLTDRMSLGAADQRVLDELLGAVRRGWLIPTGPGVEGNSTALTEATSLLVKLAGKQYGMPEAQSAAQAWMQQHPNIWGVVWLDSTETPVLRILAGAKQAGTEQDGGERNLNETANEATETEASKPG